MIGAPLRLVTPRPGSYVDFSLFGIPLSPSAVIDDLFKYLTSWVATGAATFVSELGRVLTTTTQPPLGGGPSAVFAAVGRIGALVAMPILVLSLIQAIARQDLAGLCRTVFLRLPLAFLVSGAAVELVTLCLGATDELSRGLLGTVGHNVFHSLASNLVAASVAGAGFVGLLLAAFAAVAAFMLWLELIVRSAAIAVATLFVPLAMAGMLWPATAHWARRLGETITALVLSKLVICAVLALAVTTIGDGTGISAAVEGIALLVLAVLSPFTLLRLIPVVEAGAIGHLEGVARRGARAAQAGISLATTGMAGTGAVGVPEGVAFAEGSVVGGPEFDAAFAQISADLLGNDARQDRDGDGG